MEAQNVAVCVIANKIQQQKKKESSAEINKINQINQIK